MRSLQKFLTIKQVLERNDQAFEGKPGAMASRDSFFARVVELSNRMEDLVRPAQSFLVQRKLLRQEVKDQLRAYLNLALMLANQLGDKEMIAVIKRYNQQVFSLSSAMLVSTGRDVLLWLIENDSATTRLGSTTEKREQFSVLLETFNEQIFETGSKLDDRRESVAEVKYLIHSCFDILKCELDCFVRFQRRSHPLFYGSYMKLRNARHAKASDLSTGDTELSF